MDSRKNLDPSPEVLDLVKDWARTVVPATAQRVLRGGGEMGALMRDFDWAATPLGPVESWSASLRTSVSILLATRHPMFLFWGPELIQFYNDGYRQSLGPDRHPSALGARGRECWAEIWPIIGPQIDSIMAGGDATWHEDHLVPITRGDRVEDVYWSYSYSPVADDDETVGGILVTVQETTQRVLAERRKQLLRELSDRLGTAGSTEAVCAAMQQVLDSDPADIAFALAWLPDREEPELHLACATGLERGCAAAPEVLAVTAREPWPVTSLQEGSPGVVIDVPASLGPIRRDLWPEPVRQAVLLPVSGSVTGRHGMFVAGANPRLVLDDNYQEFLAEIAHLVSQALNHLLAREQEHLAERRLRNAQRLQAVGALAGGVAHEVNNQMTVVLGMGEFVLRRLGPNHAVAGDVRSVLEAGSRAARVSQQLLTFTRQQFTQPQVLDPAAVMAEVEQLLTELLGDRGILRVVVQPGVSLISADRGQLEQALVDLVANARDALGSGGEVTITVSDVRLTSESSGGWGFTVTPGGYVQIAVADNGHGMDESTLSRIFDPFFTTKPVGQGPGLGLSMVYGVVKRHDGYVWAESRPGQGTTMRLFWPAVSETVRDANLHRGSGAGLEKSPEGPPTVWVVEDEANVRELLARTLTEEGMRVVTAADGAEALGLMETESIPPAMVITDLVMPRVHGRQVADALARRYPETSVLFMSGYAADDMVRRGLLPANAAFLQKPFSPSQLVQALGAIVR